MERYILEFKPRKNSFDTEMLNFVVERDGCLRIETDSLSIRISAESKRELLSMLAEDALYGTR